MKKACAPMGQAQSIAKSCSIRTASPRTTSATTATNASARVQASEQHNSPPEPVTSRPRPRHECNSPSGSNAMGETYKEKRIQSRGSRRRRREQSSRTPTIASSANPFAQFKLGITTRTTIKWKETWPPYSFAHCVSV